MFNLFLSIAATVAVGIAGVYVALRLRDRTRLTFLEEDCIPLFKSIVQSMDSIDIQYEQHPISQSLVLYKGCLVNTGNKDIDKTNVHEPVQVILPESYAFLETKIVETSPRVKATRHDIDERSFIIEWDLLKKNEFIRFDALLQSADPPPLPNMEPSTPTSAKTDTDLSEEISAGVVFSHRIANLGAIQKEKMPRPTGKRKRLRIAMSIAVVVYLAMGIYSVGKGIYYPHKQVNFMIQTEDGRIVEFMLRPITNGMLQIASVNDDEVLDIEPERFKVLRIHEPVIRVNRSEVYVNIGLGSFLLFFAFIAGGWILKQVRRERRLKRIMRKA